MGLFLKDCFWRQYPFKLRTDITYTLSSGTVEDHASRFTVSVRFTNLGEDGWPLPVYNGWREYTSRLSTPADRLLVVDGHILTDCL